MMVDFALEAERHEGLTPEQSIYQACLVRFRPIMMTTLAAMFGALPLAIGMGIGSELRKPLGVAIVRRSHRVADTHALHDSRDLSGARSTAAAEKEAHFAMLPIFARSAGRKLPGLLPDELTRSLESIAVRRESKEW